MPEAFDVFAQDRRSQAARAAVHDQVQVPGADQVGRLIARADDVFQALQFAEMIPGALRSQAAHEAGVESCVGQCQLDLRDVVLDFGERIGDAIQFVVMERAVDIADEPIELVELDLRSRQRGRPDGDAAADVAPDQRRVEAALGEEGCPDRIAAARVQVGHADGTHHAGQLHCFC